MKLLIVGMIGTCQLKLCLGCSNAADSIATSLQQSLLAKRCDSFCCIVQVHGRPIDDRHNPKSKDCRKALQCGLLSGITTAHGVSSPRHCHWTNFAPGATNTNLCNVRDKYPTVLPSRVHITYYHPRSGTFGKWVAHAAASAIFSPNMLGAGPRAAHENMHPPKSFWSLTSCCKAWSVLWTSLRQAGPSNVYKSISAPSQDVRGKVLS